VISNQRKSRTKDFVQSDTYMLWGLNLSWFNWVYVFIGLIRLDELVSLLFLVRTDELKSYNY